MDRLEKIREIVDGILMEQKDPDVRRNGFVHLYGVSAICGQLAIKRELDPQLCSVAGMLHDIYTYITGLTPYHAHNSEETVRVILRDTGDFTAEEQMIIRSAIFRHSYKNAVHGPYDELLKDADVLQHFLYNTDSNVAEKEVHRLKKILSELGINDTFVKAEASANAELKESTVIDKRKCMADLAEELAKRDITGEDGNPDFHAIIRYWPDKDIVNVLKAGWCAAFVYHCCMQAGFILPIKYPEPVPCRFAGVKAWLIWAQLPEINFYHPADEKGFMPQRGDIVIYENILGNGPHDHIGIVLDSKDDILITAEGNVGNRSGICRRNRYENVNGFVRIDNSYVYR